MAKQRTYIEDGKEYIFNNYAFKHEANRVLRERRESGEKISVFDFESEIGEHVCRSQDSVKKWKNKGSSPSDLDMVKSVAEFLGVEYHKLLVLWKVKEVEKMEDNRINVNQSEKDVVKEICTGLMDYVQHIGDIDKLMLEIVDTSYTYNFDHLYNKLNMSVFEISEETYKKLRRLISEVQFALFESGAEDVFNSYNNVVRRWTEISKTYYKLETIDWEGPSPFDFDDDLLDILLPSSELKSEIYRNDLKDTLEPMEKEEIMTDSSDDKKEGVILEDSDSEMNELEIKKEIEEDAIENNEEKESEKMESENESFTSTYLYPEYKDTYGPLYFEEEMGVTVDKYYDAFIKVYMTNEAAADSYSRLMVSSFIDVIRYDFPEYFPK